MRDQASELRRRMAASAPSAPVPPAHVPVVVLGSGKGGVGKSVLATLLAGALAAGGRRTLLFDACQNQGNLHVLLGVRPAARIEGLLAGEVAPEALLVPVTGSLWLLPGESGAASLYGLTAVDRARLHHRMTEVFDAFDAVVVDSGPGIEATVRATMRAARVAVVSTPEPAAMSDAYALIKILTHQVPSVGVDVLVNRARDEAEGEAVFERLALAAERFLRRDLGRLGTMVEDGALAARVRRPGALLEAIPAPVAAIAALLPAALIGAGRGARPD